MSALKLYDLKTHEELSPHAVNTKPVGLAFEVFQEPGGGAWHEVPSSEEMGSARMWAADRFKKDFPHLLVRGAYLSPVSLGPVESP